jgi:OOP family OmpA-OmpF porin
MTIKRQAIWMRTSMLAVVLLVGLTAAASAQIDVGGMVNKAATSAAKSAGNSARDQVIAKVNAKLKAEAKKNQCSFKTDSDELAPGCDHKLKNLANVLVEMKKQLEAAKIQSFKFEVSGHTDSKGKPEHNKELSQKRAAAIVKELTARGVPASEIIAVGFGSEKPLVTPDDTEAKRAKNRRYEVLVHP